MVSGAGSGPRTGSSSPGTRGQTLPDLGCPHGLGTSTSGSDASQIVLQALCGQANPGPLTTPLINPEYKNSPAGFPASPPSPPTAPQGEEEGGEARKAELREDAPWYIPALWPSFHLERPPSIPCPRTPKAQLVLPSNTQTPAFPDMLGFIKFRSLNSQEAPLRVQAGWPGPLHPPGCSVGAGPDTERAEI